MPKGISPRRQQHQIVVPRISGKGIQKYSILLIGHVSDRELDKVKVTHKYWEPDEN
jgi:hypothetical protein